LSTKIAQGLRIASCECEEEDHDDIYDDYDNRNDDDDSDDCDYDDGKEYVDDVAGSHHGF
jgi:hypothetical protein